MRTSNEVRKAVEIVANKFNADEIPSNYMGCTIKVTSKQEPYKYTTNNNKPATMSARYWGVITYPDGTTREFKKQRGGAIARLCGVYVREEHEAKKQAEANGDVWECARRYYKENK